MGGEPDGDAPAAQVLDLAQVLGDRLLPKARQPAAAVCGEEQHDLDSGLVGGLHRCECLVEAEVVELAHSGVAGGAQLAVDVDVAAAHGCGGLQLRLGEHELAPGPEVRAAGPRPRRARWNAWQ